MVLTIFNRKGNAVVDTTVVMILLVVFGVVSVFSYSVFSELNTDIQADADVDSLPKNITGDLVDVQPSLLDSAFVFIMGVLVIGMIISVFLIDTHPLFFFVNVILLIGSFTAMFFLSNGFSELMTDDMISAYTVSFPYTTWIMNNFMLLSITIGFIILIAMFMKFKLSG